MQNFLREHGYQEAPVTLDNNDWVFAAAFSHALKTNNRAQAHAIEDAYIPYMLSTVEFFEKRSMQILGRECPQVLLIHASRLNAEMMPALLAMFQARGYSFVTIEKAMSDSAYKNVDPYTGLKGISWIHRWGLLKGMPIELEPAEPSWITKLAMR
jgi:peptidoglycan/xylan/chitin deacetylase (PgdA/CDA1 family)